jgi:hypothetical protein
MSSVAIRSNAENAKHNGDLRMNGQGCQVCWGLKNVSSETSSKILDRLNSLNSAEEIAGAVATYAGQRVLSIRIARRIFSMKEELGKFQDLQQVTTVPGIGAKRFTSIINALGDPI